MNNVITKCFACDRMLEGERYFRGEWHAVALFVAYVQVDGESTTVPVGRECYRKVVAMDASGGYQPPLGGPRLFLIGSKG